MGPLMLCDSKVSLWVNSTSETGGSKGYPAATDHASRL
jgi:hypothetical protein